MKEIEGFEGRYSITEDGRVFNMVKSTYLKPGSKTTWYVQVVLIKNGIRIPMRLHRVVAKAFIPNPNNFIDINHKNGIKTDNRVENLEWCSRSHNMRHSFRVLKRKPVTGIKHPKHKLVLDFQTGIFYDSCAEAAFAKDMPRYKLLNNIKTTRKYGQPMKYGIAFV